MYMRVHDELPKEPDEHVNVHKFSTFCLHEKIFEKEACIALRLPIK
ncbi:hypothetical protein HMPREF1248_1391 [Coriobacteriaceae bacterium BV3Ac1]|nr:hypothetical protein HMPREF1248_1391 [Coriobacteriaceae bacterium BV3Ac1]